MSAPDRPTPPLTNRGCFTPSTPPDGSESGVVFHLDYLKVSVFESAEWVLGLAQDYLIDAAALPFREWEDRGESGRWASIHEGPGPVHVLTPKNATPMYSIVEIKGRGCQVYGPDVLQGFMRFLLDVDVRFNGLRIDLAFDHVPFTPYDVDQAIRRGDINSRCLKVEDREWMDNEEGQTAYLGKRKAGKLRRLRVYNKRGYTRCEAEFRKEWAKTTIRELAMAPMDQWPTIGIGLLRGMVDFVDSGADDRPDRCPLLPWWAELVGDVEKVRNLSEADRRQYDADHSESIITQSQKRFSRAARSLVPIIDALGIEYVEKRLRFFAEGILRPEDEQFAEALRYCRGLDVCDLPPDEECTDVPF